MFGSDAEDVGTNRGGGILVATSGAALTLHESRVSGNQTTGRYGFGGAVYSDADTVTIENSTISGNRTLGFGAAGGAIRSNTGDITLVGTTINGNRTVGDWADGGAIATGSGFVIASESTISDNVTTRSGGGIYKRGGYLSLTDTTLVNNTADRYGGGVWLSGSNFNYSVSLTNSVLANNEAFLGGTDVLFGQIGEPIDPRFVSADFSLIGIANGLPSGSDNLIGTLEAPIDPRLGPLADNGGERLTHAPLPGSPLIDAGLAMGTLDQRGSQRVFDDPLVANAAGSNGADIGAVEAIRVASGLVVNSTLDSADDGDPATTTLREAIGLANESPGANRITFDFDVDGPVEIALTEGELLITDSLTISGSGQELLTIDAGGNSRVFRIDDGRADNLIGVTISGVTLTGGKAADGADGLEVGPPSRVNALPGGTGADGGAIVSRENLSVVDSTITGSAAGDGGQGADFVDSGAYDGFVGGRGGSGGSGGAIFSSGQTLTILRSTITGNRAGDAGTGGDSADIYGQGGDGGGGGSGGAISHGGGTLTITDSVISGNRSGHGGDGGRSWGFSAGNWAGDGGGVAAAGAVVSITDSVLRENATGDAGSGTSGRYFSVLGNGGGGRGAGVFATGDISISDTTVSDNRVGSFDISTDPYIGQPRLGTGAGVYASGNLTITRSTVSGNDSQVPEIDYTGSGVTFYASGDGRATISNSTITGNQVGVYRGSGSVEIHNTTLADHEGYALRSSDRDGEITITNSIVTHSRREDLTRGSVVSGGHNLLNPARWRGIGDITTDPTDLIDVDPLLGPLADNGGPTLTHALLPGSPALDAGPAFQLLTPTAITSSSAADDLFAAGNLIDNSGFDAAPTIDGYRAVLHGRATDETGWVTDRPGGIGSDYYDLGAEPVLTISLGDTFTLTDLVVWGYDLDRPHNNEAKTFFVEFSDNGGASFGDLTILEHERTGSGQETLRFGQAFTADTVRLTVTDNHAGTPGSAGGDRVGLGEIKFLAADDPITEFAAQDSDQRGSSFSRVTGAGMDIGAYEAQAAVTRVPGDYNGDNAVNAADFTVWRDALAPTTRVAALTSADGDGDGLITTTDYDIWRSHFGFAFEPLTVGEVATLRSDSTPDGSGPDGSGATSTRALQASDAAFAAYMPTRAAQTASQPLGEEPTLGDPAPRGDLLLLAAIAPTELDDFEAESPEPVVDDSETTADTLGIALATLA